MDNMQSVSLATDLYQLTMAQALWRLGEEKKEGVFHFFFRKAPFRGSSALFAGWDTFLSLYQNLTFSSQDITYLSTLKTEEGSFLFETCFLAYLAEMEWDLSFAGVEEGRIVFPLEPLIRVEGNLIQALLIESLLLHIFNFQTAVATKAARMCTAAQGDPVIEMGLRRSLGLDSALMASRAAFIGGCSATSFVKAGEIFSIPVKGTQSHNWILAQIEEKEAFAKWAEVSSSPIVFLVDTYDTKNALRSLIPILEILTKQKRRVAIRLDSGDLLVLSRWCRDYLDKAGLKEVQIMASNNLDEYALVDLKKAFAPITIWGIGSKLVVPDTLLDGVYKMGAFRENRDSSWKFVAKHAENREKKSLPGRLFVKRFYVQNRAVGDGMYSCVHKEEKKEQYNLLNCYKHGEQEDLFIPFIQEGNTLYRRESLESIRQRFEREKGYFSSDIFSIDNQTVYIIEKEKELEELEEKVWENKRGQEICSLGEKQS